MIHPSSCFLSVYICVNLWLNGCFKVTGRKHSAFGERFNYLLAGGGMNLEGREF